MTRRRLAVIVLVVLVVVVAVFAAVKFASPGRYQPFPFHRSDGPFGPFGGYAWVGDMTSMGASFRVPLIRRDSPPGLASTWIGAQGQGPPSRFVQIGVLEGRAAERAKGGKRDGYFAFWSDTAHHYQAVPLFNVDPGDVVAASLTLGHGRWMLGIVDDRSKSKARFSTPQETVGPFTQAEWTQEDPGNKNRHVDYPSIAAPVFHGLTVNSAEPAPDTLYSQWISVNHVNLAPTALRDGSFTLVPAPAVTAAGARYLRLTASTGAAFERFELERAEWSPSTPHSELAGATRQFRVATRASLRSLRTARWPKPVRHLVEASEGPIEALIEAARPPSRLTAASFAAWSSAVSDAALRAGPPGARLRLALGLPAFGVAYER